MANPRDRAEYLIYRYVDGMFIQMRLLASPDLALAMNLPAHSLSRNDLEALLFDLFDRCKLVAKTRERGFFTPSASEIAAALDELRRSEPETFYGLTSGALPRYREFSGEYWCP